MIEVLPLLSDEILLFVELLPQFAHLHVLLLFLVLNRGFEISSFILLHLDYAFFALDVHPERFSLVIKFLLLLLEHVQGVEEALDGGLTTLAELADD